MSRYLTPGRIIAFVAAVILVFSLWGVIFVPGGLGSNIVLGLLLAGAAIYFITLHLGPYLDDMFFYGASRPRALAVRRAEGLVAFCRNILKQKGKKLSKEQVAACNKTLDNLTDVTNEVRQNWVNDEKVIRAQINRVEQATSTVDECFSKLPGVAFKHRWFTGAQSLAAALLAALALRVFIVQPFQIPSGSMMPTLLVGDHLFVSELRYGLLNPFSREPSYFFMWDSPKAGDVIVFTAPNYVGTNAGQPWIKRVIAGPGQTVKVVDSVVHVDDKPYPHIKEPELVDYVDYYNDGEGPSWHERQAYHTREKIGDLEHDIYLRQSSEVFAFDRDWPSFLQRKNPGLECTPTHCVVKDGHLFVMGDNRGNSADSRVWGGLPIASVKGKALLVWMSVDGSQRSLELGRFTLPAFRWKRWFTSIN